MQDYVRLYAEGIFDRLAEEGITLSEEPIEASQDGLISSYRLDLGQSGEDDLSVFANEFALEHYPNEFSTPSPTRVQILLCNQISKQLKGVSADLAAIFHLDEDDKPRITFRIVGGRIYLGSGDVFQSPDFSKILQIADTIDQPSRVVEVGEE